MTTNTTRRDLSCRILTMTDLPTIFEVLSPFQKYDMEALQFKNGSRDPDHAPFGGSL